MSDRASYDRAQGSRGQQQQQQQRGSGGQRSSQPREDPLGDALPRSSRQEAPRQAPDGRFNQQRERGREPQYPERLQQEPARRQGDRTGSPDRARGAPGAARPPAAGLPPAPPPPPPPSRRTPVKAGGMMGANNPMMAELVKQARLTAARKAELEGPSSGGRNDDDAEEGDGAAPSRPQSRGPTADERDAAAGGTASAGGRDEAPQPRWQSERSADDASSADDEEGGSDGGGSGGGAQADAGAHKRRHNPIVWAPPGKAPRGVSPERAESPPVRQARSGVGGGGGKAGAPRQQQATAAPAKRSEGRLVDRVQEEAARYKQQQLRDAEEAEDAGISRDAPAAFKASPSLSSSASPERRRRAGSASGSPAAAPRSPGSSSDDDDDRGRGSDAEREPAAGPPGGTSRWVEEAPDGAGPSSPAPEGVRGGAMVIARGGDLSPSPSRSSGSGGGSSPSGGGSLPGSPRVPRALRSYNMLSECRSVEMFERLNKVSEGTYGVVYRARDKVTGKICALKRVKMDKEQYGFPVTSIREINILLNFHHPNIVNVDEVVVGRGLDQVYMVMEFMDHDLKCLMDDNKKSGRAFSVAEVKCLMLQLLEGVAFLHEQWVLHRDLKCANILYSNKGELKICDFGMSRQFGSPLAAYTHMVITLWYRPPELLLGQQLYSTAVDVWSAGCIMAELLQGKPLFKGNGEMDQIDQIVRIMGTPTEDQWPGLKRLPNYNKVVLRQVASSLRSKFQASFGGGAVLSEAGLDLLQQLLTYDPERRMSARDALDHRWFAEAPLPQTRALMPTFKSSHDGGGGGGGN